MFLATIREGLAQFFRSRGMAGVLVLTEDLNDPATRLRYIQQVESLWGLFQCYTRQGANALAKFVAYAQVMKVTFIVYRFFVHSKESATIPHRKRRHHLLNEPYNKVSLDKVILLVKTQLTPLIVTLLKGATPAIVMVAPGN